MSTSSLLFCIRLAQSPYSHSRYISSTGSGRWTKDKYMTKLPSNDNFENEPGDDEPPEPYSTWEEYFDDFDRQLEEAQRTTVRRKIGNPPIRLSNEIPYSEIEEELDKLVELLYDNLIVIDFIHDIDDRKAYLFITDELLDEPMDDIRIPNMYSHFIYEEFHPNDEDDIKLWAGEFLDIFFKEGTTGFFIPIGDKELYDAEGRPISVDEFKKQIDDFHALYSVITEHEHEIININIDRNYATVEVETSWAGLNSQKQAMIRHQGRSMLRLKRSLDIGWDVIQAEVIGWNKDSHDS
jgi:hypothetical protein